MDLQSLRCRIDRLEHNIIVCQDGSSRRRLLTRLEQAYVYLSSLIAQEEQR